jgi:hypothetical protein
LKSLEKPRSKTPTSFGSTPLADTFPLRSRTPLPTTTNNNNNNNFPIGTTTDAMYSFDRQATVSRSARDTRPVNTPRSKTPGPEFYSTASSAQYAHTMKPRSKTPTAYEFSSSTLQNRFDKKILWGFN